MKFSGTVLFLTLWFLVVYAPLAHMVWGKGGFLNASLGGKFPTLDFAGGTVVHISSGVSALVCALYMGKRTGYPKQPMPPHSLGLSFIGACLLWGGWFGYDGALDAFGVHGAGGTIGALLTGVFAQQAVNPIFGAGKPVGGLDGHWGQVGNQFVGVLIAWSVALVGTIVLLKITDLITGVRVTEEHEIEGLDVTQHGEEAYNLES